MATPFAPLKIEIAYLHSPTPITLLFTRTNSRYLVQNWNKCNFGLFLPKFGYHGNALCSLENSNSIFEFAIPETLPYTQKVSRYLVLKWNKCNFGLFLPKFGCHGNSLCSLENWVSIFEFAIPETLPYTQKVSRYLVLKWNKCNFGLFLPKFGCHGNALCSLENSNSIFEFGNPENHTIHAKSVLISCPELK